MPRERGDELLAELVAKVALTAELQMPIVEREKARDRLVDFCTRRVVRRLAASDRVLYSAASGASETRLLLRALRAQHASPGCPAELQIWSRRFPGAHDGIPAANRLSPPVGTTRVPLRAFPYGRLRQLHNRSGTPPTTSRRCS